MEGNRQTLCHDKRENPTTHKNNEGPELLNSEIRSALDKMNRNKSAGPDLIMVLAFLASIRSQKR